MFSFFNKNKSFKLTKELLDLIPDSQKIDPVTHDLFREGDRIVICKNCKAILLKETWNYLKQCNYCYSEKTSNELILVERRTTSQINEIDEVIIEEEEGIKEIDLIVIIFPSGDAIDIELPIDATAGDIIEVFRDSDLLPEKVGEYKLVNKNNGNELDYTANMRTSKVRDGDTLILTPSNNSEVAAFARGP